MYKFRVLEAFYDVKIRLTYPGLKIDDYQSREHIVVHYRQESNTFQFDLEDRTDIRFNGEPPNEIMDVLMMQLGNTLYPLYLEVSPVGEIVKVRCFDEVKQRWEAKAKELLKEYYTLEFERYIRIASRNLVNEELFRQAITKNSFIRLFFLPSDIHVFDLPVSHFPHRNDFYLFSFDYEKDYGRIQEFTAGIRYPVGVEANGALRREFTEQGDLAGLKAEFSITDNAGDRYRKEILILSDMDKRESLKSSKFWSFLLD